MTDESPRNGTGVVSKPLPADCLYDGRLRDGIAERLQRFQQAAHPRLANLTAVERVGDQVCLSWEFIDGRSLADASDDLPEEDTYRVLRELIDAAEALHGLGLVHGNLHGGNVIISERGVFLTDASPLLVTDPKIDVVAIARLMEEIFQRRGFSLKIRQRGRISNHAGESSGAIAEINHGERVVLSLRSLASLLDGAYLPVAPRSPTERVKRNNLAWAIVLILLAIAAAILISWYYQRGNAGVLQSLAWSWETRTMRC